MALGAPVRRSIYVEPSEDRGEEFAAMAAV
jgi:hypothetical protein